MLDLVTLATPVSNRLVAWFVETMLVASAFAVLAILATRIRWLAPGPAARHAFWLLILIKLVTPPLIHWPWSMASQVARAESVEPELSAVSSVEMANTDEPTLEPIVATVRVAPDPAVESAEALSWSHLTVGITLAWVVGSLFRALFQGWRLARFGRGLSGSEPVPAWLIEEAASVGQRMGVRVPPIRVVRCLATPLVWCLGRPVLLVPLDLLKTLEATRWRAILAHELAHLHRGDHWVRRLELVAELAWWWCPLYWWVCRKLEFEAELAADAWAVWDSPADRLSYAESLIRIGTHLSLPLVAPPKPALGVAGTGRSFERRLTMILKDRVERHVSMPSLLLAATLGALALPSWTLANQAPDEPKKPSSKVEVFVSKPTIEVFVDDDDDDDDKKEAPAKKPAKKKTEKSDDKAKELDKKQKAIEIEIEAKFGPGSEFAKKMEAMGQELAIKFGDSSNFTKQIEAMTKEIEAKFGPNSEFVKELEAKFGPDSDFAKEAAKSAKEKKPKWKFEARVITGAEAEEMAKAVKKTRQVEVKIDRDKIEKEAMTRRIEAIQSAIDKLQAELKSLKAETKDDEDQD